MLFQVWDYLFVNGVKAIFSISLSLFSVMEEEILSANDLGSIFTVFKSFPRSLSSITSIKSQILRFHVSDSRLKALRKKFSKEVYSEHDEKHAHRESQTSAEVNGNRLRSKLVGKLHLFSGLAKLRNNCFLPKEVLKNFGEDVVLDTY